MNFYYYTRGKYNLYEPSMHYTTWFAGGLVELIHVPFARTRDTIGTAPIDSYFKPFRLVVLGYCMKC